jgi:uncharacterized membrane protein
MNEPVDAATPMTITLQAQEWNSLISLLHDVPAPFRITAPLIQKITQQAQEQASYMPPSNGDARPQPVI